MKMSKSNDNKISKTLMSKMTSHLLFPIAKIYSCCEPLSSRVLRAWIISSRWTFWLCVNLSNLVLKGLWDEHPQQQESGPRLKSAFPFEEILKEILLSYINPSFSYIIVFSLQKMNWLRDLNKETNVIIQTSAILSHTRIINDVTQLLF